MIACLCIFALFINGLASVSTTVDEVEDPEFTDGFFEGDMEIELPRNGLIAETSHWPNSVVHYKIDDIFDKAHKIQIRRAMSAIEEASCVRFYEATENITNYVHIISTRSGCTSAVGYQKKRQELNLNLNAVGKGCFILGRIIHELLHSLGFHHQQSAADRDDYVKIVKENIMQGMQHNFQKFDKSRVTDFGIEYDFGSIMHYGPFAFSKNGEKTIVPLPDENIELGQRRALTVGDIAKLNIMYKCPSYADCLH